MSEERIDEALRALRRADGDVEPGSGAEVRALLAFRRQRRRRKAQRITLAMMAMAAGLVAMFVAWRGTEPQPLVLTRVIPAAPAPPPLALEPVKSQQPLAEVTTPFYPLMPSEPPFESGLLVRVTVQARALRSVGIPVAEEHLSDPVLADVLVGQDDLARAIRFVSYQ